jgi:HD domain
VCTSPLALAADLAIGQPFDHVLRSCAIAMRFADRLELSPEDRDARYWVALLIIPGCTAVSFELSKLFGDDIALRAAAYAVAPSVARQMRYMLGRAGGSASLLQKTRVRAELLRTRMRPLEDAISAHCAINVRLAERMGLGPTVTSALAHSFARWDGKGIPAGVRGPAIALSVRIASLADMVEVAHREQGVQGALDVTWAWSGIRLDPDLVAAWSEVGADILGAVDGEAARRQVMSARPNRSLTAPELESALELLADYADLKSPWFLGHSRGASALAAAAAVQMGLPEGDVTTVRHAALVHDLGRTGVPNSIWDKAGPLSDDELERVRLHASWRRAGAGRTTGARSWARRAARCLTSVWCCRGGCTSRWTTGPGATSAPVTSIRFHRAMTPGW